MIAGIYSLMQRVQNSCASAEWVLQIDSQTLPTLCNIEAGGLQVPLSPPPPNIRAEIQAEQQCGRPEFHNIH